MLQRSLLLAALLAVMLSGAVVADETAKKEVTLAKDATLADESACSKCPIEVAMAKLPRITYVVGEEECHCAKSAAKKAAEQGVSIVFAVGEERFEDKGEAKLALLTATEEFVESFATPHSCKASGKTFVAGQSMHCSKSAAKLASLVGDAMKSVHLTYKVGDKDCYCPHEASSLAKASGEDKLFVIGEESTCCSVDARIKVAHAKFRAAVEALAEANAPSEEAEAESAES